MSTARSSAKQEAIAEWFAQDFSWSGLKKHFVEGWWIGKDGNLISSTPALTSINPRKGVDGVYPTESDDASYPRPATLQDIFRHEEDRLVVFAGRQWTRFHCPLESETGEPSPKKLWDAATLGAFHDELRLLLESGSATPVNWKGDSDPDTVDRRAQCKGFVFPSKLTISGRVIHANFSHCWFGGDLDAQGSVFGPGAWFHTAMFEGEAHFERAVFLGRSSFYAATFLKLAEYTSARFAAKVSFYYARFLEDANFTAAKFQGYTWFKNSHFETAGTFSRTVWRDLPAFERATLHPDTTFDGAVFTKLRTIPLMAAVIGFGVASLCLLMSALLVSAPGLFVGLVLAGLFLVAWTKFGGVVCGTIWQVIEKRRVHDRAREPDETYANFRSSDIEFERLSRAFRTLTSLSEQTRNRRDAARFFIFEMKARRLRSSTSMPEKLFSFGYDWLSGYGEGFVRPLAILLALTFGSASFYAWMDRQIVMAAEPGHESIPYFVDDALRPDALSFSIRNVLQPFSVWSLRVDQSGARCDLETRLLQTAPSGTCVVERATPVSAPLRRLVVQLVASAQSLITIVLLFLFGLALRRRFQI